MDGSTIPYYVVEERKKLNRCIEEAPNDYEKEIYRAIRNMPVPYEKLNEILENSRERCFIWCWCRPYLVSQKSEKQKILCHWDTNYFYDSGGRYIYSSE